MGPPESGRSVPVIVGALVGEGRICAHQYMRGNRTGALRGHPPQKGVRRRFQRRPGEGLPPRYERSPALGLFLAEWPRQVDFDPTIWVA